MQKQKLNKGDLVVIVDYSYSLRLGLDGVSDNGSCEPNARQKFKVLVTNCSMPTYRVMNKQQHADTIIMGEDDNIVWLICSRFAQVINPAICPEIKLRYFSGGKDITDGLSQQSKWAVRNAAK